MISTTSRRPPRLETVRRRLDRWRQTRAHARAPLPGRLWAAAVALVSEHGLCGTARALGVSYGALKRHVEAREQAQRADARNGFVELSPGGPVAADHVVEIAQAAGVTVRVRLNGVALAELAEFTRRVLDRRS